MWDGGRRINHEVFRAVNSCRNAAQGSFVIATHRTPAASSRASPGRTALQKTGRDLAVRGEIVVHGGRQNVHEDGQPQPHPPPKTHALPRAQR